jgi:hypothetical protein
MVAQLYAKQPKLWLVICALEVVVVHLSGRGKHASDSQAEVRYESRASHASLAQQVVLLGVRADTKLNGR